MMEFPADMKVNQELFFHITAEYGTLDLYVNLLRFYAHEAQISHVVLNVGGIGLKGPAVADRLASEFIPGLVHVLVIDKNKDVTDVKLKED